MIPIGFPFISSKLSPVFFDVQVVRALTFRGTRRDATRLSISLVTVLIFFTIYTVNR